MSLTATTPDGSGIVPEVRGASKVVTAKVAFDSSYPTGGEPLTAAMLNLSQIDSVVCSAFTNAGRLVRPVLSSGAWKLLVAEEGAAVFAQVANATDLSADFVFIAVSGK